jgi:hypothetical protein
MIRPIQYVMMTPPADFNCWELVRMVYRADLGIEVAAYAINCIGDLAHIVEEESKVAWSEVKTPTRSGLVLGSSGPKHHVGVVLPDLETVLHFETPRIRTEPLRSFIRKFKSHQFFCHALLLHC